MKKQKNLFLLVMYYYKTKRIRKKRTKRYKENLCTKL